MYMEVLRISTGNHSPIPMGHSLRERLDESHVACNPTAIKYIRGLSESRRSKYMVSNVFVTVLLAIVIFYKIGRNLLIGVSNCGWERYLDQVYPNRHRSHKIGDKSSILLEGVGV